MGDPPPALGLKKMPGPRDRDNHWPPNATAALAVGQNEAMDHLDTQVLGRPCPLGVLRGSLNENESNGLCEKTDRGFVQNMRWQARSPKTR